MILYCIATGGLINIWKHEFCAALAMGGTNKEQKKKVWKLSWVSGNHVYHRRNKSFSRAEQNRFLNVSLSVLCLSDV